MNKSSVKDQPSPRAGAYLALGAIAGLLFLGLQCFFLPLVMHEGSLYFRDPDSYTWLERTRQVLEEPGFHVTFDSMDNYPEGYASHWTQPLHWVLALLTLLFRCCGAGAGALEWAGLWLSPLFGALTLFLLSAYAFRRWPWPAALLTTLGFLANPYSHWTFSLGRPDHQCLLVFLATGSALLLLGRSPQQRENRTRLVLSALLMALSLWVTVQALSLWALFLGAQLVPLALARNEDRKQRTAQVLIWSVTALIAALGSLLLEKGSDFFEITADSLSLGQCLILLAPVLALIPIYRLKEPQRLSRTTWFIRVTVPCLFLGVSAFLWLWLHHQGSLDPTTAAAMGRWFDANLEFQPAVIFVDGSIGLGRLHQTLGLTFYALPFLLIGLAGSSHLGSTGKWLLGTGLAIGSLLVLWQMRWRDLHLLTIAPALGLGLFYWAEKGLRLLKKAGNNRWQAGICLAAGVLLLLPWINQTQRELSLIRKPAPDALALKKICEWIRLEDPYLEHGSGTSPSQAVLAAWDQGPMVRYWSGRPVVAGPYHRNMPGILDTLRAFTTPTEAAFEPLARRRAIRYVLRTPHGNPDYDTYTFQEILAESTPLLRIHSRRLLDNGAMILRKYGRTPGVDPALLRYRLENNQWQGWNHLVPVEIPGLTDLLGDAELFPYLYRYLQEGK